MKSMLKVLTALTAFIALSAAPLADVWAKRLGGGGSGGVGMQRQITPAPAPARPSTQPTQPAPRQPQAAPQQTAPAGAAAAPNRSSWMGPLTGIAAGLGLAWLFSSLGLSEAFGSLLLLLVFAAAGFFLVRALMHRRAATSQAGNAASWGSPATATANAGVSAKSAADPMPTSSAFTPGAAAAPDSLLARLGGLGQSSGSEASGSLRDQLDEAAFLAEAKRQFVALQAAHDRQEWDRLATFLTPELLAELQRRNDWTPEQHTEVLQLDAELIDVVQEGDRYVATVRFQGLIREAPQAATEPFAEYWHLVKPVAGGGWRLAGIQPEPVLSAEK